MYRAITYYALKLIIAHNGFLIFIGHLITQSGRQRNKTVKKKNDFE